MPPVGSLSLNSHKDNGKNIYNIDWTVSTYNLLNVPFKSDVFNLDCFDTEFQLECLGSHACGGRISWYKVSLLSLNNKLDGILNQTKISFSWLNVSDYFSVPHERVGNVVASVTLTPQHDYKICKGELTVFNCTIVHAIESPCVISTSSQAEISVDDLANDFRTLLQDALLSDFTIVVGVEEFKVHKAVLAARSTVFRAMFSHDNLEINTNRVEIQDVPSDAMKHLLHYLYTGKVKYLTNDVCLHLFAAADKYDLPNLKQYCSAKLTSFLSHEIALDVLLFASLHQDKNLQTTAEHFIVNNADVITHSEQWLKFLSEHIELANKIVLCLASKLAQVK